MNMTQKKHNFTVLSDKVCIERRCLKRLKLNVVERKEPHNIIRCYEHDRIHKAAVAKAKDLERRKAMGRA
jgi:hypothetical protein